VVRVTRFDAFARLTGLAAALAAAMLAVPGMALGQTASATSAEPGKSVGPPAPPAPASSEAAAPDGPVGPLNLLITSQRKKTCGGTAPDGTIVVCGRDNGEDVRVPSTTDSDPNSREAQNTGIPRAPNVSGLPDCSRGCIGIGKAPPKVYIIDLKAIPEAPKGSDADKVAKGEIRDR